jgi:hypothetical protein
MGRSCDDNTFPGIFSVCVCVCVCVRIDDDIALQLLLKMEPKIYEYKDYFKQGTEIFLVPGEKLYGSS